MLSELIKLIKGDDEDELVTDHFSDIKDDNRHEDARNRRLLALQRIRLNAEKKIADRNKTKGGRS